MLNYLKTALSAFERLKDAKNELEHTKALSEVQSAILSAQSDIEAMRRQRDEIQLALEDLQDELKKRDDWEQITKAYRLTTTDFGSIVYKLLATDERDVPDHFICPNCYDKKTKSILQNTKDYSKKPGTKAWFQNIKCHVCDFQAWTHQIGSSETSSNPSRSRTWTVI